MSSDTHQRICRKCNGKPRTYRRKNKEDCPSCNGTGKETKKWGEPS